MRTLLLGVLLLVSSTSLAAPRIGLLEAARLAEGYVRDHQIENSDRYLAGVSWHEVNGHPEKSCWSVMWASNEMMLDAQLVVWVCDDGKIHYQDKWA